MNSLLFVLQRFAGILLWGWAPAGLTLPPKRGCCLVAHSLGLFVSIQSFLTSHSSSPILCLLSSSKIKMVLTLLSERSVNTDPHTSYGKYPYPKHPPAMTSTNALLPVSEPKVEQDRELTSCRGSSLKLELSQDPCHLRRTWGISPEPAHCSAQ